MTVTVRPATPADEADVVAFTRDTWPERGGDYLPRVFADWAGADDETQRTFVAEVDGAAAGVVRCVLLTPREAWMQGMRVAPAARGRGLSVRLNDAAADWARAAGAGVARNMVFSSNAVGLAAARASGFEPATSFRWAYPTPDADAAPELAVEPAVDAGWTGWQRSAARDHLRGLALATDESWALCELTPETLARAADESHLATVVDGGARGLAFRTREYEREDEAGEPERWAEYGVAAWTDPAAAEALFADVARDAGALGADRARVLVPDAVAAVSDAALAGADLAGESDFVLELDLTRR